MKPGRRRLLIPGLLIALLVVVMLAAAIRRADATPTPLPTPLPVVAHTQVSVMADPRITESSGLAASQKHAGIVYTINDSGDTARVFAVDIASGAVVGVTTVTNATWRDAEAMALWGGKLWVADTGDNTMSRKDQALYVFDEPGAGNHQATATRYPIAFTRGRVNAEAMAIVPGRIDFYSKQWPRGFAFELRGRLTTTGPNVAQLTRRVAPAWTSDATSTPDGRFVLLHGAVQVDVRDARTWRRVHSEVIPMLRQGETIAVEPAGQSYLIGSEGVGSPLVRIAFNPATFTTPPPVVDPWTQIQAQHPVESNLTEHRAMHRLQQVGPFVLAGLVLLGALWWARRRRRGR